MERNVGKLETKGKREERKKIKEFDARILWDNQ